MMVSDVGRTAIGSSRSSSPLYAVPSTRPVIPFESKGKEVTTGIMRNTDSTLIWDRCAEDRLATAHREMRTIQHGGGRRTQQRQQHDTPHTLGGRRRICTNTAALCTCLYLWCCYIQKYGANLRSKTCFVGEGEHGLNRCLNVTRRAPFVWQGGRQEQPQKRASASAEAKRTL